MMKIVSPKTVVLLILVLLAGVLGTLSTGLSAEKEQLIVVTPFQINAEASLDFLKKGIDNMLETRLTEPGRSRVVFATSPEDAAGRGGDYIVEGTILIFGSNVSTDVKLFDAASGAVELSFNETGSQKGDVIRHIDLFADNVRTQALGLPSTASVAAAAQPGVPSVAGNQPPVMATRTIPSAQDIWRGPYIKKKIDSLQVTDIDNDGKSEILVLAENELNIYRREGNAMVPVAKSSIDEINVRCHFIDVIDLDKDGQKEICISGVNTDQLQAAAMVYRIEGTQLVKILGPVGYLLRVVDTADGPILLGQETRGDGDRKLKTSVVELGLGGSGLELVPVGRSFPFADSVFGIAFGDVLNDGTESIAVLGRDGYISLYSSEGRLIHKGSDEYGGSDAYVEFKGMRYTKNDGYQLERLFFQQRLLTARIDQSGKTGLVVVNNVDAIQGLLNNTRAYRKSHIDVLLWNELGLVPLERGQTLSGYISDYCLGDTDADGRQEVVFAVVAPTELLKDRRSQIFSKSLM